MENQPNRYKPYIQTFSAKKFYPLDPRQADIDILDIAHALSNICRFTGHTKEFYSVAQHSFWMSFFVPKEHALAALLHDAAEAYVCDISAPVKSIKAMAPYSSIEEDILRVILTKFGLKWPLHESIKEADGRMLFTEKRDLLQPMDWGYELEPFEIQLISYSPPNAKTLFLQRFRDLTK